MADSTGGFNFEFDFRYLLTGRTLFNICTWFIVHVLLATCADLQGGVRRRGRGRMDGSILAYPVPDSISPPGGHTLHLPGDTCSTRRTPLAETLPSE